jgi:hypothetical protein
MPTPTLLPEEQEAERFLRERGLDVHRVPTSASKTPEFIVEGDARGYVVEVKARDDSKEWTRAMKSGRVAHQKRSMGHSRWAEDVAHDAVNQCRSVDAQHLRWWVLWLAIKCAASAEAMFEEAIGSLFGVRQVVYYDPHSREQPMRNCLFARPGVFERHPEIVASVVSSGGRFGFCVNDQFAGDFGSFRESVLWSSFARIHPPATASDLTGNRGFFRADLSVNRKDDSALQASLERAYGLEKAVMLDMQVHSASMVPSRLKGSWGGPLG